MRRSPEALVLVAALLGCTQKNGAPAHPPEQVVPLLFEALARGDCDGVRELVAGEFGKKLTDKIDSQGCAEGIRSEQEVRLVRVVSAVPDGRFPDKVYLVHVEVRFPDREPIEEVARVEFTGASWKVTDL